MGQATIFSGQKIKALKSTLNLNGGADVISSSTNPTVSGYNAEKGSILLNTLDGRLYQKNDSGNTSNWTAVGSGTSGKNYVYNPNFNANLGSGWTTFKTTMSGVIPTGSLGSADAGYSAATTSSSPLEGAYSMLVASTGALAAGNGLACSPFTIDAEDKSRILGFSFYYQAVTTNMNFSGTSSNTYAVYIYDVTNAAWIQPAGVYNLVQGTGIGRCTGTFQTTANSTSYQIAVMCVNATAAATSIKLDDFVVGPQVIASGVAASDYASFTPTGSWVANTTYTGQWRRVGDQAELKVRVATSGAPTSTTLVINLPAWAVIDTTKISNNTSDQAQFGFGAATDNGIATYPVGVYSNGSTTSVKVNAISAGGTYGGATAVNATVPFTFASGDMVDVTFSVPVVGWSSNTVMSSDTDTRVVAALIQNTASSGTAITSPIVYNSTVLDTHGAYSAGEYTIPVSGVYEFTSQVITNNTFATASTLILRIQRNTGGGYSTIAAGNVISTASGAFYNPKAHVVYYCNAGDKIQTTFQSTSGSPNYSGTATDSFFSAKRLSGPATVAGTETVGAFYSSSAGQSFTNSTLTTAIYATKSFDTHNAMNTTTGLFSAPVSGIYEVKSSAYFATAITATATDIQTVVRVDGSSIAGTNLTKSGTSTTPLTAQGSFLIRVNAGQTIGIALLQNNSAASTQSLLANATFNWISIMRVGN